MEVIFVKKRVLIVMLCMAFTFVWNGTAALAEEPTGRWTGTFNGVGKNGSAAATFRSDGSCTLTTLGISVSGSYGDGKIHMAAYGYSMDLTYSYSGDSMTITGRLGGHSGKMILSREEADASPAKSDKPDRAAALLGKLADRVKQFKNRLQE